MLLSNTYPVWVDSGILKGKDKQGRRSVKGRSFISTSKHKQHKSRSRLETVPRDLTQRRPPDLHTRSSRSKASQVQIRSENHRQAPRSKTNHKRCLGQSSCDSRLRLPPEEKPELQRSIRTLS
ncbi:hypothetical protein K501DRAFT_334356 [Backusella circina FSU 941]|nr:hypothetical protein K501DRAFT_334356 [Backusella circina FSU 941]